MTDDLLLIGENSISEAPGHIIYIRGTREPYCRLVWDEWGLRIIAEEGAKGTFAGEVQIGFGGCRELLDFLEGHPRARAGVSAEL